MKKAIAITILWVYIIIIYSVETAKYLDRTPDAHYLIVVTAFIVWIALLVSLQRLLTMLISTLEEK